MQDHTPSTNLLWLQDNTPFSTRFQDVYFSRDDGLAESTYVFLEQNALRERFTALPAAPGHVFTIGETGFGTGLNFLLAWRLWRACAPAQARLVFRSVEAWPLRADELARAHAAWPELAGLGAALRQAWPPLIPGLHVIDLDDGRVRLQLYIGDVLEALEQGQDGDAPAVDAWFLDGFAPARNPAMWSPAVMQGIAAASREGTSFATFTVAAGVRAALAAAGFAPEKHPGYGRKREMLRGRLAHVPARACTETPWHRAASRPASASPQQALVIGAGIAGCSTARALAARGWQVTLLEAEAAAGLQASGNPQGMLFTQLPRADSAHGEFTLHSYLFARRFYAALSGLDADARGNCGLLQLYAPTAAAEFAQLQERFAAWPELARFLPAADAADIAGFALAADAVHLPGSGWIVPPQACAALLNHARIAARFGERLVELVRDGEQWHAHTAAGTRVTAPVVILANAHAAAALMPDTRLPLTPVRGQITLLPEAALPAPPRCVICAEGYVAPPRAGWICAGASFRRGDTDTAIRDEEQQENLHRLAALVPGFDPVAVAPETLRARTGVRCATGDRLPLCGGVPLDAAMRERFAPLRFDARAPLDLTGAFAPGLYLNIGHGSRGLTSAPLCAELLAAELSGAPLPVTRRVRRALAPARFVIRALIKGRP